MKRRFNASERAALYLIADGKCQSCNSELPESWHADHVHPYIKGGLTDVINGQALCPKCNLTKGKSDMIKLREWQTIAIDTFLSSPEKDFLLNATPGAGKTLMACELARVLRNKGIIDRVIVVAPTDALRQQWADRATDVGINLVPVFRATDYGREDFNGCVTTYQQLASSGKLLARRVCDKWNTLAIIDEIHHAGEDRSWGDALQSALEPCVRRLALTGTPWRTKENERIPFVRYDETKQIIIDYTYSYGAALEDKVCRPVQFSTWDGDVSWLEDGIEVDTWIGKPNQSEKERTRSLATALSPEHEWMPGLLKAAADELDAMRERVPDAGGLIIASSVEHAESYRKIMKSLVGEQHVTIATSDDSNAKDAINAFRNGSGKWLVAVKMVSEGVDINRLLVGVYATNVTTSLFFRQAVGRFVRMRPGTEEISANVYLPAVRELTVHANEICKEKRHALREDEQIKPPGPGPGPGPRTSNWVPLSASAPELDSHISNGSTLLPSDEAKDVCSALGRPMSDVKLVQGILEYVRSTGGSVSQVADSTCTTTPKYKELLAAKQRLDPKVKQWAWKKYPEPEYTKTRWQLAYTDLCKLFGVARDQATIEQLNAQYDYVVAEIADAQRRK